MVLMVALLPAAAACAHAHLKENFHNETCSRF
jgi:hypothetical protein